MWSFSDHLEDDVAQYDGDYANLIREAPSAYRLLTGLLEDPDLPPEHRPLVLASVAYFILPFDAIPEDLHGPVGYLDDLYLVARTARRLDEAAGSEILDRNWSGEMGVDAFVDQVLEQADDYFEEPGVREAIFEYVGYEEMTDGTTPGS